MAEDISQPPSQQFLVVGDGNLQRNLQLVSVQRMSDRGELSSKWDRHRYSIPSSKLQETLLKRRWKDWKSPKQWMAPKGHCSLTQCDSWVLDDDRSSDCMPKTHARSRHAKFQHGGEEVMSSHHSLRSCWRQMAGRKGRVHFLQGFGL